MPPRPVRGFCTGPCGATCQGRFRREPERELERKGSGRNAGGSALGSRARERYPQARDGVEPARAFSCAPAHGRTDTRAATSTAQGVRRPFPIAVPRICGTDHHSRADRHPGQTCPDAQKAPPPGFAVPGRNLYCTARPGVIVGSSEPVRPQGSGAGSGDGADSLRTSPGRVPRRRARFGLGFAPSVAVPAIPRIPRSFRQRSRAGEPIPAGRRSSVHRHLASISTYGICSGP